MAGNEDRSQKVRNADEVRRVDNVPTSVDGVDETLFEETNRAPRASSHFATNNQEAVPVYERATSAFSVVSQAIGVGSIMLLGRHKGRKYVTLSAPVTITTTSGSTSPNGFQWAHDRNLIDTGSGFQLNPGDSAQIDSEAEIFVGPLPGKTTGYVQAVELFNVLGGPGSA